MGNESNMKLILSTFILLFGLEEVLAVTQHAIDYCIIAQGDLAYSNGEFEETSMKAVCEQKCKNVPNESCDDDIGTDPCKTGNDQLKCNNHIVWLRQIFHGFSKVWR